MNPSSSNILKQYWGFDSFRPMQQEIIESVLSGKDTLALLPTGGGKSICYQVPAMAKEGLCLVISPLIALMKDQVENLKKKGIEALLIHSGIKYPELNRILKNASFGNYKFLYLSPERLQTRLFQEYLPAMNINLIAVDEAHCISQWGYDFRPSYLQIAKLREELKDIPVLALTASATKEIQNDICDKLLFKDRNIFHQSFSRPGLSYSVFDAASKINKLIEILTKVKGSSLVYCNSRRKTKEVADLLQLNQFNADFYHAGLSNEERSQKQERWIRNEISTMVCTNAFGMGIDKPDVRVVVHYDSPDGIESYYQEAGRAGRDGKRAYAVLLYNNEDIDKLQLLPELRFPPPETIRKVYAALMNYLQVPADYGEDQYYDFDMQEFIRRFQLNIHEATYSIKTLEQEGYLQVSEQIFIPSTVSFTCSKENLYQFEESQPELDYLVKALLRTYSGVFDMPVSFSERHLASLLKKDAAAIKEDLIRINRYGIISYQPAKETPQIKFLVNRVRSEDLFIKTENIRKRKTILQNRINKMIAYLQERKTCRDRFICNYFDESTDHNCGLCDNCLATKREQISPQQFEQIRYQIMEKIEAGELNTENIHQIFPGISHANIRQVMDFLIAEEAIEITANSRVIKRKKG